MTTKLTATQRAQDASWEKHGDNHYARMIEAYAFASRLETLLREARPFVGYIVTQANGTLGARIDELLDGPDEAKP